MPNVPCIIWKTSAFSFGRAAHHVAARGHDLVREARVVEAAAAKRHRLDRAPGDRAAERDRPELGHHLGHEPARERRVHEIAERDAGLGDAGPLRFVDVEDGVEIADVDLIVRVRLVVPLRHLVRHGLLVDRERPRRIVRANLRDDPCDLLFVIRHA